MYLYSPISLHGATPAFEDALPEATYELCGDNGIYVAVGSPSSSLVYRGTFDKKSNTGSWAWRYMKQDDIGLELPPFSVDYSAKRARVILNNYIASL